MIDNPIVNVFVNDLMECKFALKDIIKNISKIKHCKVKLKDMYSDLDTEDIYKKEIMIVYLEDDYIEGATDYKSFAKDFLCQNLYFANASPIFIVEDNDNKVHVVESIFMETAELGFTPAQWGGENNFLILNPESYLNDIDYRIRFKRMIEDEIITREEI